MPSIALLKPVNGKKSTGNTGISYGTENLKTPNTMVSRYLVRQNSFQSYLKDSIAIKILLVWIFSRLLIIILQKKDNKNHKRL